MAEQQADEMSDAAMADIWTRFKTTGDVMLRNKLVERYQYLVRMVARRMASHLPRSIQVEDLQSSGTLGLMQAIENFDPKRGSHFQPYAITRIHGSVLDEFRAQDWVPRLVRTRAQLYHHAVASLKKKLERDPSDHEVAIHLDVANEEAVALRTESSLTTVFTLDDEPGDEDNVGSLSKLNALVDRNSHHPMEVLEARELAEIIIRNLSPREKTIVEFCYREGLTMGEIAKVMRLSEGLIQRTHRQLLRDLKKVLAGEM